MKQATVVAACAGYAAYCLFVGWPGVRTSPDSAAYLSFSPLYPTGYPAFLTVFGERGAVTVQPLLYAAALAWLSLEALKRSSLPLALAIVVACTAIPDLVSLHSSILTESLFISCQLLILAASIRFHHRPDWRTALFAAAFAGIAATLRNAGYVFLFVLLVMALFQWRRIRGSRLAIVAAIAVPVLGAVASERALARLVNGPEANSLFGRHMFAKAALIEAPRAAPPLDPSRAIIEDHLEFAFNRIRQTIAAAPSGIRSILTVYYETCLAGPCARDMRNASIGSLSEAQQDTVLAKVALDRIARAPINFIRLTARNYGALWMAYKQAHPATTPILNEFLATYRPLPYESLAFSWREPGRVLQFQADPRVRFLQPIVAAIAWITGGLAVFALISAALRRTPSTLLATAALSALIAHAGVLFSATFAPGISRFTVSFWPAVMTSMVLAAWWILRGHTRTGEGQTGAQEIKS